MYIYIYIYVYTHTYIYAVMPAASRMACSTSSRPFAASSRAWEKDRPAPLKQIGRQTKHNKQIGRHNAPLKQNQHIDNEITKKNDGLAPLLTTARPFCCSALRFVETRDDCGHPFRPNPGASARGSRRCGDKLWSDQRAQSSKPRWTANMMSNY